MSERPKIALVPSVAEWFKDIWFADAKEDAAKSETAGRYAAVMRQIQDDLAGMTAELGRSLEVFSPGLIFEMSQVEVAVEKIKASRADLLVICVMMWTEDPALLRLVELLPDLPVVMWCYCPEGPSSEHMSILELFARSATVGTLQIAGAIQRLSPRIQLVMGNYRDEAALRPVLDLARAAWVKSKIQQARFALVPAPYAGMSDLPTDMGRIEKAFGCSIESRPMSDFIALAESITPQEIKAHLKSLEKYPRREVTDDQLERGSRASLALAKVPSAWGVQGIALDDLHVELHVKLGARPALPVQEFYEGNNAYGIEGDMVQAIACYALHLLTEQPAMFVEIFNADPIRDILVPGHAGMHDMRIADPKTIVLIPDYEYETSPVHGPWTEFSPAPGPATLGQFVLESDGNIRLLIAEGEILPVAKKVEGFPACALKAPGSARHFLQWAFSALSTHHWVLLPGHHRRQLGVLAKLLGMESYQFRPEAEREG
jgi:L-arabinose isomerase